MLVRQHPRSGSFVAALRREWQFLWRNPWDLAMITWVPLLSLALLWWIFSAGLPGPLPIAVLDLDHSGLSRQLTRFLQASPGLKLTQSHDDPLQVTQALKRGDVYAAVEIPAGFSSAVEHGQAAQVTLLHNAQFASVSSLIQRDVRSAVATLSAGIEMMSRNKHGEAALAAGHAVEPLRANGLTLFNVSSNYEPFLTAALMPALLHILAMTAGACAVGRELRDKTLHQWLVPGANLAALLAALAGKLTPSVLSLGGMGALAFVWLSEVREWHPAGSLAWVVLALFIFVAVSAALGALASALTRSMRMGLSASGFLSAPAFAFSGIGFPLLAMPDSARWWANALPYTHYIRVQLAQWLMGAPLGHSAPTVCALALALLVLGLLGSVCLRRASLAPDTWGKR